MREQNRMGIFPLLQGLVLVAVTSAWIAGIVLESFLPLPALASLLGAGVALVFVVCLWNDARGRLAMMLIFCMLLGAWRYQIASPGGDSQALSHFISNNRILVRGAVADEPKLEGRSRVLVVTTSGISIDDGDTWQDAHGQLEVRVPGTLEEDPYGANYGDAVQLRGILRPPTANSAPGIFASMTFPGILVGNGTGNSLIAWLYHMRAMLATLIARALPQPEAALLIAIVLSLRTPALSPLIQEFNAIGLAHLIAPSGFKVTVLAGLVMNTARKLYEKRKPQGRSLLPAQKRGDWPYWLATCLVVISIIAYTILSGLGPAALRAGIMGVLLVLAPRLGRTYNVYTGLAVSALLMSALDPFVLWDTGFLLSFFGTLGIIMLTPYFQALFAPLIRLPLGHQLGETVAVTLAAQVATLPIFTIIFKQISLIAPLANVLTVPLLETFILLGLCICITGWLLPPLTLPISWIVTPLLQYVIQVIHWCFHFPYAYLPVDHLDSSIAWCYYVLLVLALSVLLRVWPRSAHHALTFVPLFSRSTWCFIKPGAALLFIGMAGINMFTPQGDGRLSVTFFDVGPAAQPSQGEAIFIRTPDGKTLLIDGGLDATALSQVFDSQVPNSLVHAGQRALDFVLLSSTRTDHLLALQDIVNRYTVSTAIDGGMLHPTTSYALWHKTLMARNIAYIRAVQGMTIRIGSQVALQIDWPRATLHKGADEDRDNTLIFRLIAPGVHMLFLGEATHSRYALQGLLSETSSNYLSAEIVQVIGETVNEFPAELGSLLYVVHPAVLVVTPASLSARQRKLGVKATSFHSALLDEESWQTARTALVGTTILSSNADGWSWSAEGKSP